MGEKDTLLDVEATAKRISLSKTKVRRMAYSGELKAIKLGTRLLFRESDVDDFIEQCKPLICDSDK